MVHSSQLEAILGDHTQDKQTFGGYQSTRARQVASRLTALLLCGLVFVSPGFVAASEDVAANTAAMLSSAPGPPLSTDGPRDEALFVPRRQVTISWQVRSMVSGAMLRLYRSGPDNNLVLVTERLAGPGVTSYRQTDIIDGFAPASYHLHVIEPTGREMELASLQCVPLKMWPAQPVRSASAQSTTHALGLTWSERFFQPVWETHSGPIAVRSSGDKPEPPTPPPRC